MFFHKSYLIIGLLDICLGAAISDGEVRVLLPGLCASRTLFADKCRDYIKTMSRLLQSFQHGYLIREREAPQHPRGLKRDYDM